MAGRCFTSITRHKNIRARQLASEQLDEVLKKSINFLSFIRGSPEAYETTLIWAKTVEQKKLLQLFEIEI